ncbi:hypothetical protein OIU85_019014 [Salix viminalis]|uniref:Uncharacterized protein n=1 Tax=Salix viminalis TaxID=40686 RepID=A0A9Q0UUY6_SALVM|nr:hypothetical protein OIU85_019014 [Salix viminalis]
MKLTSTESSIPFSAFWLRSSVVSVLISLISDTWANGSHDIKFIFRGGVSITVACCWGSQPSPLRCTTALAWRYPPPILVPIWYYQSSEGCDSHDVCKTLWFSDLLLIVEIFIMKFDRYKDLLDDVYMMYPLNSNLVGMSVPLFTSLNEQPVMACVSDGVLPFHSLVFFSLPLWLEYKQKRDLSGISKNGRVVILNLKNATIFPHGLTLAFAPRYQECVALLYVANLQVLECLMNSIHSSHLFSSTEMIDEEFRIDEQFSEFWNRDD